MSVERQVRAFAGVFILGSLILAHLHASQWIYFTAFVGANLLQSAFTKFCPLEMVLNKMKGK